MNTSTSKRVGTAYSTVKEPRNDAAKARLALRKDGELFSGKSMPLAETPLTDKAKPINCGDSRRDGDSFGRVVDGLVAWKDTLFFSRKAVETEGIWDRIFSDYPLFNGKPMRELDAEKEERADNLFNLVWVSAFAFPPIAFVVEAIWRAL